MVEEKITRAAQPEQRFTKSQLLAASRYKNRKDLIGALLVDGKTYTLEEVDAKIKEFGKGAVN